MQLAHLNWQEAEKVLADPETLVVIPVGSTEQHGTMTGRVFASLNSGQVMWSIRRLLPIAVLL